LEDEELVRGERSTAALSRRLPECGKVTDRTDSGIPKKPPSAREEPDCAKGNTEIGEVRSVQLTGNEQE